MPPEKKRVIVLRGRLPNVPMWKRVIGPRRPPSAPPKRFVSNNANARAPAVAGFCSGPARVHMRGWMRFKGDAGGRGGGH